MKKKTTTTTDKSFAFRHILIDPKIILTAHLLFDNLSNRRTHKDTKSQMWTNLGKLRTKMLDINVR